MSSQVKQNKMKDLSLKRSLNLNLEEEEVASLMDRREEKETEITSSGLF